MTAADLEGTTYAASSPLMPQMLSPRRESRARERHGAPVQDRGPVTTSRLSRG